MVKFFSSHTKLLLLVERINFNNFQMTTFNCKGAWYDKQGRRHNFEIESDRAERSFIKELVEARYPTNRVVINNVSQKR